MRTPPLTRQRQRRRRDGDAADGGSQPAAADRLSVDRGATVVAEHPADRLDARQITEIHLAHRRSLGAPATQP
jgi:hypothetical protein